MSLFENPSMTTTEQTTLNRLERGLPRIVLAAAAPLIAMHAFIPLENFIHRGDDVFYYFKVAHNFSELGFWSFDGIHATNGVQPLWAIMLTGLAQLLSWMGLNDLNTFARAAVGLTALIHYISCIALYRLIARKFSPLAGLTAAGAFLFPLGIVWARVWGLENALYSLLFISTVTFAHCSFFESRTYRGAIVLGLLLGLTGLARLNAGILIPLMLLYCLWRFRDMAPLASLKLVTMIGAVASCIILPYLFWNLLSTGHLLPISGATKVIITDDYLAANDLGSRFSPAFYKHIIFEFKNRVSWFLTSRALDGLWIIGSRLVFNENSSIPIARLILLIALIFAAPMALGAPRAWLSEVREQVIRLGEFGYLLIFGLINASICVNLYPTQLKYAMIRWWLVECEIIITVVVAILVTTALIFIGQRIATDRVRRGICAAALLILVGSQAGAAVRTFWTKPLQQHDWSYSWNDECYAAAQWMADNLPADARIGAWNAGVIGYYAPQQVTNLDGLINNFDYLPYLAEDKVADYIRSEGIQYLADMEVMPEITLNGELNLTSIYSSYHDGMKMHYRIYRVENDLDDDVGG